jgi:hypothetical protein
VIQLTCGSGDESTAGALLDDALEYRVDGYGALADPEFS